MGEECMQGLVVKPRGKKPLRKPRRRWEDHIVRNKMGRRGLDLSRSGWGLDTSDGLL
jgi:hypothetical protein